MPSGDNQLTESETLRNRSRAPDPQRFRVSKGTLRLDAFMTRFILFGGLGVIFAIFGIFLFILAEILPLFGGATVERLEDYPLERRDGVLIGTDEWAELPFVLLEDGSLVFHDFTGQRADRIVSAPLPEGARITSWDYHQDSQTVVLGFSTGRYLMAEIKYSPEFAGDGARTIVAQVEWENPQSLGSGDQPVLDIDVYVSAERKTIAGIQGTGAERTLLVNTLVQKRSLFGASGFSLDSQTNLTEALESAPRQVLVGANARSLVVRDADDRVHFFATDGNEWHLRQTFLPFAEGAGGIASMHFIQGEVSLSFTSGTGDHVIYSLYRMEATGDRRFGKTKDFPAFPGGADGYAMSLRNKAFLLANEDLLSLRYGTTADVRWESAVDVPYRSLVISGKFDRILGLTEDGRISVFALDDPHPEAGFKAFFAKIWYEGQDSPQFLWQSTGGSDDFEPKLSLIPLIVGSLKGTLYALLFAIPTALLAAIYTSQFLNPGLKRVIKPGIEIMASLPSVVLGFLAALWLAPLIEDRIPSVILICIMVPAIAVLFGYLWNLMPIRFRVLVPKGWEFVIFVPVMILVGWAAWHIGPIFERIAFRITDPATGEQLADFRLWWNTWSGNDFQQRNSLVVGFMMGFAVIPIIYTITDDALSAVPTSLTSGSLALGASRWQTTARIILPTASAGIFSACMIGLGRAVGETMIVVMATGNTPIMDWDIFSGMRTLSANIAVELPEAPHGGTLYRTLFLGAFVLFVLTFAVNTLAEVMRNRLREKYKVIN